MENECMEYIKRVKLDKNDTAAWNYMFFKYKNYLLKIISRYIFDNYQKEDVLQESWIRVYKMIDRYDEQYKFTIWLMMNTVNVCKNWLKSKQINSQKMYTSIDEYFDCIESSSVKSFEEDISQRESIDNALKSIKNENEKLAFKLRFIDQLSLKEISIVMDEKESVIKNWVYRTRDKVVNYIKSS